MKVDPINILIIICFVVPLLKGFIEGFSSNTVKRDVYNAGSDIGFIISLIFGFYLTRNVFIIHSGGVYLKVYKLISSEIIKYIDSKPILIYIVALPLVVVIIHSAIKLILKLINRFILYPVLDLIENSSRDKSSGYRRLTGVFFQIPKSFCYVLFVVIALNIISILNLNSKIEKYSEKSSLYAYICETIVVPVSNSDLAKQLPNIINDSFKIEVVENNSNSKTSGSKETGKSLIPNTIVYYNGVTLDEGVKSNDAINNYTKKLVSGESNPEKKAEKIYAWIGTTINYDDEQASRVMQGDYSIKSGAIPTFSDRTGICFDYSCLYVAMSRAAGLKVRLVTGEGFNGVSWVGHAWNQVYIPSTGEWINVDATFYDGGDYFDNERFNFDHKNANVVGEW